MATLQLNYYVIFSVTYKYRDVDGQFLPIQGKPEMVKRPLFVPTDVEDIDGKLKDRKYCATLTPDQLIEFMKETEFTDTCQTMGSLTLEYGMLPAISFEYYDYNYSVNAYVSPVPGSDHATYSEFEKLDEKQQAAIQNKIGNKMHRVLSYLEKDLLESEYWKDEFELPEFAKSVDIDFHQMELELEF